MKIPKKRSILIIGIVSLGLFLFPKDCGKVINTFHKDCICLGLPYSPLSGMDGAEWYCIGLPLAYNCTVFSYDENFRNMKRVKISCDSPIRSLPPECINELLSFCEICRREKWLLEIKGSAKFGPFKESCSDLYERREISSCRAIQGFCITSLT